MMERTRLFITKNQDHARRCALSDAAGALLAAIDRPLDINGAKVLLNKAVRSSPTLRSLPPSDQELAVAARWVAERCRSRPAR